MTRSLAGSFAFCGIAVAQGDTEHLSIRRAPGITAYSSTMFRVASVSKLVVGQAVAAFVKANAISWDTDISATLGWSLRHPTYPDRPVTLGMVASHSAGLTDEAGYVLPAEISLQEWCTTRPVFAAKPGTHFDYCNLGYVILAEVLARLSGQSFVDAVAPYLPNPGGFNWQGVGADQAANRLPTYRSNAGRFEAQIDDEIAPIGAAQSATVFSPQGGLRTSMGGMLQLAKRLPNMDSTVLWTPQMGTGNYLDGVFECYGPGLQIFHEPRFYPRALIGHFGNAYGFNGGVWHDIEADISFAYALNGLPVGEESDDFSEEELHIFSTVAGLHAP